MLASMPAITFPFAAAASRLSRRKERDADSTNHRSHATTPSVANAALYENICLPPRPRSAGFTFGPSRNSVWDSCSSTNGVFGALASSSSRDSGSGIERPRTGMSQNLASLASLPEDDLDCVQVLCCNLKQVHVFDGTLRRNRILENVGTMSAIPGGYHCSCLFACCGYWEFSPNYRSHQMSLYLRYKAMNRFGCVLVCCRTSTSFFSISLTFVEALVDPIFGCIICEVMMQVYNVDWCCS